MPLTDREVRHASAEAKVRYLADGAGLYLKITPAGRKIWFYRSQRAGAPRWTRLGEYPAISLLQARIKANAKAESLSTRTVASAYAEYVPFLEHQYDDPQQIKDRFTRDILPALGEKRLDSVTRTDCSEVIQKIVDRGSRVAANRTLPDLKRFFAWCVERGYLDASPAALLTRRSAGGRERSKDRALTFEELEVLVPELVKRRNARTYLALACTLLTAQRTKEVRLLDRADLVSPCWWYIPAEHTKLRRLQKVYLSPQARAAFRLAFHRYGDRPFASLSRCAMSRAASRIPGIAKFTPHDFRRTLSTRLADLGVAPHVVEKMLNHKLEGVLAVYNVAEYLPERRAAWRLWGRTLAAIRRKNGKGASADDPSRRLRVDRAGEDHRSERPGGLHDEMQRDGPHAPSLLPEGRRDLPVRLPGGGPAGAAGGASYAREPDNGPATQPHGRVPLAGEAR